MKVLDFGIAQWLGPEPPCPPAPVAEGTPAYMAPEQARDGAGADHKVDVWSLGVILWECLTGTRPLGQGDVQPSMRGALRGLGALIERMLEPEPARRPADLREVFTALSAWTALVAPPFDAPGRSIAGAAGPWPVPPAELEPSGVRGRELATRPLE